ncbi:hypothetical protein MUN84_10275 [Hymenobacter sp. 5516J-16]|uniref:hypothetical protein n=1 Tax=Hymenobacter sp. 5516J-16 TaxID=2932253 RepID=UPI001FD20B00|nr:hypothetical protein [Hymenobacter sp. 5516J-16]UOQ78874.1 hypothetical protein MUN84_10275 [Hymenobacter sp. 5516J-16]
MHVFRWCRGWAAIALLATSCRSEQVAFQFRPAPPSVAPAPISAPSPTTPSPAPAPAPLEPTPTASVATPARPKTQQLAHLPQPPQQLHRQLLRRHQSQETTARPQAQLPARRDTWHLLLGGLLIAAGVVTGLLLGGWLGLGVGALIVVLGYYFLVLGLGGKHAWLEIFQEFFNM